MSTNTEQITGVLFEMESKFSRETFVDIPLKAGLTAETLTTGDNDPVFLTLPIAQVGATSRNGRKYPREAIQGIVVMGQRADSFN